ncbi:MAG: phosphoribosylamine--glycine ligase [Veillonellaceae bacterium]|nr:phosphoribosylamine--glycine ligase [Veillonellaceae bacterium]
MRILVVGGGGREHALVWKLSQSPRVKKIYCAPGNPGIGQIAECVDISADNIKALCGFAREHSVDLTVVGPEKPLTDGIVDYFTAQGLKIFGPTQEAAQLEGSKTFAKERMKEYGVPTADFAVFSSAAEARAYVENKGTGIVVKADGLAAGKGVVVAETAAEALAAIDEIMLKKVHGNAGDQVVLEERLVGEEASLLAFTDGVTVVPMVAAQDHKRVGDGDVGPNTGGMGAYAPAPVVTPQLLRQIQNTILQPMIDGLRQDGILYQGVLYAGLMITADGPKVIEFNARFGDPETQVVLPLLDGDLVKIMEACIDGTLAGQTVKWRDKAAVCVVLAAGGYPGEYRKGDLITGLGDAEAKDTVVFHAGTGLAGDEIVTHGGRVLGVTAMAENIATAVEKVYPAVAQIKFAGMQYRKDIAHRALEHR